MQIVTRTGVSAFLSAAHRDRSTGCLHGHTWEIVAWFADGDASRRKAQLEAQVSALDHAELPADLAWGEDLARHFLIRLEGCDEVIVNRPAERIYAIARVSP